MLFLIKFLPHILSLSTSNQLHLFFLISGLFFRALHSSASECLPSFTSPLLWLSWLQHQPHIQASFSPLAISGFFFKTPMIFENPLNIQPCLMTNTYRDIYTSVSDFWFCQTSVRIFFDFQSFWMMGLQWSLNISCTPPNTLSLNS